MEIKLPNVLTLEEKLQLPRLFDHDSKGLWSVLMAKATSDTSEKPEKNKIIEAYGMYLNAIEWTVKDLCTQNELYLQKADLNQNMTRANTGILMAHLKGVFGVRFSCTYNDDRHGDYLSSSNILRITLGNLIKNALRAAPFAIPVQMHIDYIDHFPEHATIIPDHAREYNQFAVFSISNRGKGFDAAKPLQDYFIKPAPLPGERGFGLYFVGLMSKQLRMPIAVESGKENVKISLYHPLYAHPYRI